MSLDGIIHELFLEANVEGVDFRTLTSTDQRRLTSAFILQDPSELPEVISRLAGASVLFSALAGPDDADLFLFRYHFQIAAIAYYADQIQDRIDDLWRDYCSSNGIFGHYDLDPPELIRLKEDAA